MCIDIRHFLIMNGMAFEFLAFLQKVLTIIIMLALFGHQGQYFLRFSLSTIYD